MFPCHAKPAEAERRARPMRRVAGIAMVVILLAGFRSKMDAQAMGFDTGMDAPALVARLSPSDLLRRDRGGWLRIRGIPDPKTAALGEVIRHRHALVALRADGFHICILLSPASSTWQSGVRDLAGAQLPLDLREARDYLARLSAVYRGAVDAWEIGNEPDIGFGAEDAETYASYLKACYLGVGSSAVGDGRTAAVPQVVMAALAMPPGPYLGRLMQNDLFSYTDGFNFHYYGYARDFTPVYRQFEDAATRTRPSAGDPGLATRRLPVFVTEFGYGLLDKRARRTGAGRARQLAWFRDVAAQAGELGIEAPMAFLLPPYFERNLNEFGLTDTAADLPAFTPAALGAKGDERWFKEIGQPVLGERATPALAWLLAGGPPTAAAHSWTVRTPGASPLVIDFIAGPGLQLVKSQLGYRLAADGGGRGELRLYNFSKGTVRGILLPLGSSPSVHLPGGSLALRVSLAPGELRVLPAAISLGRRQRSRSDWMIRFQPDQSGEDDAIFATAFLSGAPNSRNSRPVSLDFAGETAERNRTRLVERRLAPEEPRLSAQGRWLVSEGVDVQEVGEIWTFHVQKFPLEPLRPAMAELPLPNGFRFPVGASFRFEYRSPHGANERLEAYFRSETGNLYLVWPPLLARTEWQRFAQEEENFTMGFFGRAELPWRFQDNQPAALVFFFRPNPVPMVYEIRNAEVAPEGR
jgi:hypothetical protein